MKLNLKIDRDQLMQRLKSWRIIIIWLLVLGLLGFTLWRMQSVIEPPFNQTYFKQSSKDADIPSVKIDKELKQQIDQLEGRPVDIKPNNLGTRDPFSP